MNNIDFSIPRRQSSKGVILYFLLATWKIVKGAWPVFIYYVIKNDSLSEPQRLLSLSLVGVLVLVLFAHAIFSYLKFYFFVEEGEFKVSKGYLKKVTLSIPLERIQTINTKQNVFQQMLNVVSVEVDTAGAATKELKIIALDKATANSLSGLLNTQKAEQLDDEIQEETKPTPKPILKLSATDLFKVGISENHIKSSLVVLAFVGGIIDQLKDYFTENYEDKAEQAKNFIVGSDFSVFLTMILIVLFIGLGFSILVIFLRYYGLSFSREGTKFHLESGLLNKKSVSIPYSKIQVLSWRTNPIRKLMDFFTLTLAQATSTGENKKQAIDIPGCNSKHLRAVQSEIFSGHTDENWSTYHSHYRYAIRYFALAGLVPIIVPLAFWWKLWPVVALAATWVILSLGLSYLAYKKRYFRIHPEMIENSSGSVGQKFSRMFNFKIQTIKHKQTWLQRRRNLVTVKIFTAGGKTLTIPYIDSQLAMELYNYLLYRVESNHDKWM